MLLGLNLEQWSFVATIAMAVMTGVGLFAVWVQIRSAQALQNQAAARQLYADFLQFAAENPDSVDGVKGELRWGSKYEWSVYLWLTALESGWLAFGGDREWKKRIASFVRQNQAYLESNLWSAPISSHKDDVKQDFDQNFINEVDRVFGETRGESNAGA